MNKIALTIHSKQANLQKKSLNALNPEAEEFNFELWATLVRAQMRTVLRQSLHS